ncbi:MAG: hypothetical protein U0795_13965 [Pirellulales bacterium]
MVRRDRNYSDNDWDDDSLEEDGYTEDGDPEYEGGYGDDDDLPLVECPYCRREIVEDSERCPYCERYLSAEDAPPAQKPWWIGVGALVCLYIVYRWVVGW